MALRFRSGSVPPQFCSSSDLLNRNCSKAHRCENMDWIVWEHGMIFFLDCVKWVQVRKTSDPTWPPLSQPSPAHCSRPGEKLQLDVCFGLELDPNQPGGIPSCSWSVAAPHFLFPLGAAPAAMGISPCEQHSPHQLLQVETAAALPAPAGC